MIGGGSAYANRDGLFGENCGLCFAIYFDKAVLSVFVVCSDKSLARLEKLMSFTESQ